MDTSVSPEEMQKMKDALQRVESREKREPKILAAVAIIALIAIIAWMLLFVQVQPPAKPCFNGLLDPGEEGVDCGGTCAAECQEPTPPYLDEVHVQPTSVSDVAIGPESGTVYILDEMRHRVMAYDSQFNHLKNFGETRKQTPDGGWNYESGGITNDKLLFPASIYAANGKLYVLDRIPRIQVLTKDLEYEKTLSFSAQAIEIMPKLSDTPNVDGGMSSIAVSEDGTIYVADELSNAIAAFDRGLNLIKAVTPGEENSVNAPRQIAIGPEGNILVADSGNARIQVFDPELNFVKSISGNTPLPSGVASSAGSIYVVDSLENKLKELDSEGELSKEAGGLGKGQGSLYNPKTVKLDSQNKIYVVEEGNSRIQVFDRALTPLNSIEAVERDFVVSFTPFYPAISPNGDIAFSDPINNKVFVLAKDLELKQVIGGKGFENTELNTPKGIAFGPDGSLFISDSANRRVQVFSSGYQYLRTITDEKLALPFAISVSEQGRVFVVDDRHKNILVFSQAGSLQGEIGTEKGITLPLGILAHGNRVYVTDDLGPSIEIFDNSLKKVETIPWSDTAVGADVEFNESLGVNSNRLLFCDNRNRMIVAYSLSSGEFSVIETFGFSLQELSILEITASEETIAVADMENHRVIFLDSLGKQTGEITIDNLR